MELNSRRFIVLAALLGMFPPFAGATTIQTNTRPEVAQMAGLWEVDSVQIGTTAASVFFMRVLVAMRVQGWSSVAWTQVSLFDPQVVADAAGLTGANA